MRRWLNQDVLVVVIIVVIGQVYQVLFVTHIYFLSYHALLIQFTDHHHHRIIGSIKKLNDIRRQQLSTTITPFIDQDDDSCLFQRNNEKIHHRFHFIKRRRSLPLLYRKKAKRSTTLSPHRYAFSSSSILLPKLRPVVKTIVNDDSISYQKQTMIELSNESIDSMNNPIKSHHNHHYQNSQYPAQQQQQKYSQSLPGLYMLPIENVTATVGRQAILKCVTNHNGPSKVSFFKNNIDDFLIENIFHFSEQKIYFL